MGYFSNLYTLTKASSYVAVLLALILPPALAAETSKPSDQLISLAVENELLQSEEIPAELIHVDVAQGIVTLSGRVETLVAAERAVERASHVKGVAAVVDQISVWPSPRDDSEITQDVKAALSRNPATADAGVAVKVDRGTLHLSGEVPSYAEKQLSELEAKRVRGVLKVENNLTVRPTQRGDEELLTDIGSLIAASAELDDADINVTVQKGVAVLTGTTGTAYHKNLASAKALLAGASQVDARGLKVDWDRHDGSLRQGRYQELDAKKVEDHLKLALRFDPRLVRQSVQVAVNNGVATLTGEVNRVESKEAAGEIAAHTTGVISVRNRLKVRPEESTPQR